MATATTPPPDAPTIEPPHGDVLYEVVNGQIVEKPMGNIETYIAFELAFQLESFARAHRLGNVVVEMLFRIDPATNLQRRPDVAFIVHERWPTQRRPPQGAVWEIVPDLAIEVVSPTNPGTEIVTKFREYFDAGVRQVWLVYPNESFVYVYDSPTLVKGFKPGDELDGGDLLPGFRLPVAQLFADEET